VTMLKQKKLRRRPRIEFLAVGASGDGDRFLKRRIGNHVDLIDVGKLISNPTTEYLRLQGAGLPLLRHDVRAKFIQQAEIEAGQDPTFLVARQPGLYRGRVCLPGDPMSEGQSDVEFYPEERHVPVYEKFLRAGNYAGWKELVQLSRGNSRLLFAYQLGFTGFVCAAFSLDPPGGLFSGPPGWGKSTACKIPSAIWGWDSTLNTRLGFGFPWRTKVAALENYAAGCNHTLLFLDEMSKASEGAVDAIMMVTHGHATARYTELTRQTWSVPLLTNSNKSLLATLLQLEFEFDAAYVDRLPDIPPPRDCACFFEDLHGSPDVAHYEARLRALAEKHHGWAGWYYGKQFERALSTDREELKAFVDGAREEYRRAAASITSSWRDLVRFHGRFATIYAAGCLAHRFEVLPLPRAELLAADLTCARDHVAFVEKEVRRLRVPVSPARAQGVVVVRSTDKPIADAVVPGPTPFDRLRRFIDPNIISQRGERDKIRMTLRNGQLAFVYIGERDGQIEYWLPNDLFAEVAGGAREASALKQELFARGLLVTTQRDKGVSYVVKRILPDGTRPFFVVIRDKAKKPPGPAHLRAAPEPGDLRRRLCTYTS
jgi:Domain of unknown function (DUF927)